MAKRWVAGGIWAILMVAGVLISGRSIIADTEVVSPTTDGAKTRVRDVLFTGNTFVSSARLYTHIKTANSDCPRIGGVYTRRMAEAGVNFLYEYYRGFGYQDVRIAAETQRSADGSEVTLLFHIQEGKRSRSNDRNPARIGAIHVTGNERISSESILVHVPLVPGQILSFDDLKQAEETLAQLGLFVVDDATGVRPTITIIDAEGNGDQRDLLITVTEKNKAKSKSVKRP